MDINYTGKFSEVQTGEKKTYVSLKLNEQQTFLFNRALYGMSVYSVDELKSMHKDKRKRIIKVNQRCQEVLNLWKQELVNKFTNEFFSKYFWHSPITKYLTTKGTFTDPEYLNTMSFKDLGVKKHEVINKLIDVGILPKNFYELKPTVDEGV